MKEKGTKKNLVPFLGRKGTEKNLVPFLERKGTEKNFVPFLERKGTEKNFNSVGQSAKSRTLCPRTEHFANVGNCAVLFVKEQQPKRSSFLFLKEKKPKRTSIPSVSLQYLELPTRERSILQMWETAGRFS